MTNQEQFADAFGLDPYDISEGDEGSVIHTDDDGTKWILTGYDTISVESGCLAINVDVMHTVSATVAGLRAAMKALNDVVHAATLADA